MIFAVDTSSARSAVALLDASGRVVAETLEDSGPSFDVAARFREIAGEARLTRVAVATGPGSFTGLRAGVAFGLGLAVGLHIPIVALATLAVQAARAPGPVLAVSEAGRGRVYFRSPAGEQGVAEPPDLPADKPVVGWLRPATHRSLVAAGLDFAGEKTLTSFGQAVAQVLETAPEVPYGRLQIEYMHSFSAVKR